MVLPLRDTSDINTAEGRKLIVRRTKGVTNRIFKLFEELALDAIQCKPPVRAALL